VSTADAIGGSLGADHVFAESTGVSRAADGAFEDAVAPLVPLLLRYFARRVTPVDDAADCTSETLIALWKHRKRLPVAESERRAWTYGIARKVLSNHQRGRVRRDLANEALRAAAAAPAAPIPDEAFIAAEALKLLPGRDQELIRLVVWEELSIAEAGRVLGVGAATARSRYSRALTRLRGVYETLDS
jgi:RNA polymerase sigma factor, sigma-70 family